MNFIDRLIGYVAPGTALRRMHARDLMNVRRGFDGAKRGARGAGWNTSGGTINAELAGSLSILRNRSRDLVRNNPYMKRAVNVLCSNIVGIGIVPKFTDPTVAKEYKKWARGECDANNLLNFGGLQVQLVRSIWESGEVLIRFRTRRPQDGLRVPLQLQVLEGDYLDSSKTLQFEGGFCIAGVQFNLLGQRTGYWLFDQHPGEVANLAKSMTSKFVPASEVIHFFNGMGRPGQVRGFPELAINIWKARDTNLYQEAELLRKKLEACFSVFVVSPDSQFRAGVAGGLDEKGRRTESLSPGMIQYIQPGEDIKFAAPAATDGYEAAMRVDLRAMAAGADVTYEQMTGDYSQVNFTSGRMGKIEFRGFVEQFQFLALVPMVLDRVAARWAAVAFLAGVIKSASATPEEWSAPRVPLLDPLRESQGYKVLVENRIISRAEAQRELGYDPEQMDAEIAADVLLQDIPSGQSGSDRQTQRILDETP
ncbi:lambda family phage portal protein [Herbaspirillum seropedicae]|uniref:phage portal protein n=1 Tax=Herbaspirillum seropedicae TaxID=964 RepID=UPI003394A97A